MYFENTAAEICTQYKGWIVNGDTYVRSVEDEESKTLSWKITPQ